MTRDEFTDLVGIEYADEYEKAKLSLEGTTKDATPDTISRQFEEIVVRYLPDDLCNYPEYKGKPYFSIHYKENGKDHIGYGTYEPKVLSKYLRDYFISSAQLEERTEKRTETHACDLIRRKTGVWLAYTSVPGYMFCKCAACGADILVPYTGRNKPIFNYCPNCGAKMKGEMI